MLKMTRSSISQDCWLCIPLQGWGYSAIGYVITDLNQSTFTSNSTCLFNTQIKLIGRATCINSTNSTNDLTDPVPGGMQYTLTTNRTTGAPNNTHFLCPQGIFKVIEPTDTPCPLAVLVPDINIYPGDEAPLPVRTAYSHRTRQSPTVILTFLTVLGAGRTALGATALGISQTSLNSLDEQIDQDFQDVQKAASLPQ